MCASIFESHKQNPLNLKKEIDFAIKIVYNEKKSRFGKEVVSDEGKREHRRTDQGQKE